MADPLDPPRPSDLPSLAEVLPPLLLGTATFNTQYVDDPAAMPSRAIVRRALLDHGLRGFDTSPYYGPAEELLGAALADVLEPQPGLPSQKTLCRSDVFLETKAGRVHSNGFDYSPAALRASVARSLQRLRTPYLDLVFCHDVEFVRPDEVVEAVRTLRRMRSPSASSPSDPSLRYVGISGFPVDVLADLAERILAVTGEPVDAVLSYGHGTLQNARLLATAPRLQRAGVSVVLNASLLNMGLLTTRGVDRGPQAAWHPAPVGLRAVCAAAAEVCRQEHTDAKGRPALPPTPLERIALRYALDSWARAAAAAGVGTAAVTASTAATASTAVRRYPPTIGPSVLGVTSVAELDETVQEWHSVLDGLSVPHAEPGTPVDAACQAAALQRTQDVTAFVEQRLWPVLGEWRDFAWASPPEGWVNEWKHSS